MAKTSGSLWLNLFNIFSIRKKNTILLGTIFLIILIVSFLVINNLKSQEYDGVRINLSGRQRMLSQKMTKETLHYKFGRTNKDAVLSTVEVFDTTLIALKNGGDASLDLSMTEFKTIPEMEDKETKAQLEKVMGLWITFKQKVESVLENKDDLSMNYIIDNNTKLLDEMDAVVVMMQHAAEKKVTRLYSIIILGILISLLLFIVSITGETLRKHAEQLEEANCRLKEAHDELEIKVEERTRELAKANEELKASNQQLRASEQQLKASNQQLRASEQQLKASNQQLRANEQQLRAEIAERKKMEEETKKHLHDLEVFYKASKGREERIVELKKMIKELEAKSAKKAGNG